MACSRALVKHFGAGREVPSDTANAIFENVAHRSSPLPARLGTACAKVERIAYAFCLNCRHLVRGLSGRREALCRQEITSRVQKQPGRLQLRDMRAARNDLQM